MIGSKFAHRRGMCVASLLVVLFGGCGEKSASLDEFMANAKQAREQGNHSVARIHLKNAAQNFPENAEARYLLGVNYLDLGDPRSAEEELRRALMFGADPGHVAPALGKSLLEQGRFKETLDETSPARLSNAQVSAEILNVRALAQLNLGLLADARKSLDEALALRPDFADAILSRARLAFAQRDSKGAEALIDKALTISPSSLEGWRLKGELQSLLGKQDGAIAAYAKAVEMNPSSTAARLDLASIQIAAGRFEEAASQLETVRKAAPANTMAHYLKALLEFRRANYDAALESVQQALNAAPRHLPSMLLAGAVEYALGRLERADHHLTAVLEQAPGSLYARKLMATIQLKNRQYSRAIQTLEPALVAGTADPNLFALAAEAYLQNNQYTKATQYFELAASLDRQNPSWRMGVGLSQMAAGETERAITALESAAALDGDGYRADILLAMSFIKRGEFDRALKAIGRLEQRMSRNPLSENLKGAVYLGKRDTAQARSHFEQALKLQPAYYPAAANLAQLDLVEGDPKAARRRFEGLLAKDKDQVQAMLALADLASHGAGKEKEVLDWVDRAKRASPGAAAPFVTEAGYFLRTGQADKALASARGLQVLRPNNPEALDLLGQALLAAGLNVDALNAYSMLTGLQPESPVVHLRLASAQMALQMRVAAELSLRKALQLRPGYRDAQIALVALDLERGRTREALQVAKQVQKEAPAEPAGYMLEGDTLMAEKKMAQAAALYEKAYGLRKSALLAMKIHYAWALAGKPEQGATRIAEWLKVNPGDSDTQRYLADDEMKRGKYASAIARYRAVLELQPANALALNDLAWALHSAKDPQALTYAEQAYRLKPDDPLIADTLGWILLGTGDTRRSVELLQKAAVGAPSNQEIRYHLAEALAASGEWDEAIRHLEGILAAGSKLPQHAEAEAVALLKQLRGR